MSRYVFEAWRDPKFNSISLIESKEIKQQRQKQLLSNRAKFLYEIKAETWEEAASIHNLRQGWGPYTPNGEPAECPKCKWSYYPEGSGFCWKCGEIEYRPRLTKRLSRRRTVQRKSK